MEHTCFIYLRVSCVWILVPATCSLQVAKRAGKIFLVPILCSKVLSSFTSSIQTYPILWWTEWGGHPQGHMFENLTLNWWCCLEGLLKFWPWGFWGFKSPHRSQLFSLPPAFGSALSCACYHTFALPQSTMALWNQ